MNKKRQHTDEQKQKQRDYCRKYYETNKILINEKNLLNHKNNPEIGKYIKQFMRNLIQSLIFLQTPINTLSRNEVA